MKKFYGYPVIVIIIMLNLAKAKAEETTTETTEKSCELQLKEKTEDEYRLTKHKDPYIIVGSPNTKIQISFKYKFAEKFDFYIGYTQIMFWDITKQSMPFRDVNFNPEFFYRFNFPEHTFVKAIDLGLYEHKSNGRDGDSSRAWNSSYIKLDTIVRFYKWTFNWDTKFFVLYNAGMDDTNRDIRNYMGYWKTKVYFVNFYEQEHFVDRLEMYFAFNSGGKYSQSLSLGSQELGFKVRLGWGKVYPFLFAQLFHGYNESLLDYNKEYFAYRFGVAF